MNNLDLSDPIHYEMSGIELLRLDELEEIIECGLQTFVEVGTSLLIIRDDALYRASYATFEEYCRDRWSMSRIHAHRMIAAAEVTGNLLPIGNIPLPANEAQARPLSPLAPEQQRDAWRKAIDTAPNGKVTAAHVQSVVNGYSEQPSRIYPLAAANHAISDDPDYDGDEWYSPSEYVDAARTVLGHIDLDPASNEQANEVVQADTFYTIEDNGLKREWRAQRVWLNPPYSKPLINDFVAKLISEYDAGRVDSAIILTNNSSDTEWFHALLSRFPACFPRGRARFWRPGGATFGARQGQTLFYLGEERHKFRDVFSTLGLVVGRLKS